MGPRRSFSRDAWFISEMFNVKDTVALSTQESLSLSFYPLHFFFCFKALFLQVKEGSFLLPLLRPL